MIPQTNSQVCPGQGKNEERKRCHVIPQLMWCLFSHAAQVMRTWRRYLPHISCHLPEQGSSLSEGDATCVPQSYTPGHTKGLSQPLLCSHNLPVRRALPSPDHQSQPCWFGPQRPQHPRPQATGTPQHSSQQPQESPGAQNQALPAPGRAHTSFRWREEPHKRHRPTRQSTGPVMGSIITAMSKPGPWHPSKWKSPPHSRAQERVNPLRLS